MAAETGCSCGEHETAALVRRSVVMIEKLADVVIAKNAAEATVEVVRRALGRFGDGARRRDPDGQPCWCDVREATWEEEHEGGCRAARELMRKLSAAMVEDGGAR